jgi:tripartite-type tricarboxylate transporter receptor subunit TctC
MSSANAMPHLIRLLCILFASHVSAFAQTPWPVRSIQIVVPFAAGSAPDLIGRLLAEKISKSLKTSVIVENVPGAGGTIGVDRVVRAAPDGYTLVLSGDAAIVLGAKYGLKPPYDAIRDLAPVFQVVITPNILVVSNDLPVKSLEEFVALARSQPDKFSYASVGNGTSSHRGGEMLNALAGLNMVHVPYTGSPLPDVMAGRVQLFFANAAALPLIREGKLKALAVSSLQRLPVAPDLPTVAEAGYPGFEAVAWFGLLAPKGVSPEIVSRLEAETRSALSQPAVKARLVEMGAVAQSSSAISFSKVIEAESIKQ